MYIPMADVPRWYAERNGAETVAIVHGADELSWGALERNANARARVMMSKGVKLGDFVAGAFDFLVHVVAADTEGLRNFVTQNLSGRPETESTQTSLVFEHFQGAGIAL